MPITRFNEGKKGRWARCRENFATLRGIPPLPDLAGACSGRDGTHFPGRWFSMADLEHSHPLDQPKLPPREILASRIFELFYASTFSPPSLIFLSSFLSSSLLIPSEVARSKTWAWIGGWRVVVRFEILYEREFLEIILRMFDFWFC